jgi:hypothetical protein
MRHELGDKCVDDDGRPLGPRRSELQGDEESLGRFARLFGRHVVAFGDRKSEPRPHRDRGRRTGDDEDAGRGGRRDRRGRLAPSWWVWRRASTGEREKENMVASNGGGVSGPRRPRCGQRVGQISGVASERPSESGGVGSAKGSGRLPGDASRDSAASGFRLLRACDADPNCSRDASAGRALSARDNVEAACELSRRLSREPSAGVPGLSRVVPRPRSQGKVAVSCCPACASQRDLRGEGVESRTSRAPSGSIGIDVGSGSRSGSRSCARSRFARGQGSRVPLVFLCCPSPRSARASVSWGRLQAKRGLR